jgi:UDP-N-acetylglucosamine diphosphorylase/glucosamine-1-phosphate N-acetyltransferase
MHLVIFEDSGWTNFAPASLSRPVFCLASGTSTLLEKQIRALAPARLTLWVRSELVNYCRRHVVPKLELPVEINAPLDHEPALLLNGRTLILGKPEIPRERSAIVDNNALSAAATTAAGLSPRDAMDRTEAWTSLFNLPPAQSLGRVASYLWDLITWNIESLVDDGTHLVHHPTKPSGPYHVVNESNVHVGRDVKISPGCVVDASAGPVIIGDGAILGANAVFLGPCYVGPGTQVTPLTLIRAGTTLGARCKIGGEVSNTLFMNCSNKPHEGFVGDSYIGEWANLGAGTTTSNLKNTYGQVHLRLGKQTIPTGKQFLGSLIGDHSKFAVDTRLMTGSYIGYCCMVASSRLTPTYLPSFTFLTDQGPQPYDRQKAQEVMTTVMKRRHREWEAGDTELLDYVTQATAEDL